MNSTLAMLANSQHTVAAVVTDGVTELPVQVTYNMLGEQVWLARVQVVFFDACGLKLAFDLAGLLNDTVAARLRASVKAAHVAKHGSV